MRLVGDHEARGRRVNEQGNAGKSDLGFGTQSDSDAFAILQFQTAHKNLRRSGKLDDETKKAVRGAMDEPLRQSFDDNNVA